MTNNNMKHTIPITLTIIFFALQLSADEFKVLSFKNVPNDISAIVNNYKRLDDNDEVCAIIKVRSDVRNLQFTASNPVVGQVNFINGEYWVYISGSTRQISIFTEGFVKFSYIFPQNIERAKVYILELSSKSGGYVQSGKGTLNITSTPENIKVGIDGFPDLVKQTPCTFENYLAGNYRFKFHRNRYQPLDSIITIEKNTQKQINVALRPTWGNLIVSTNNETANFEIGGRIHSGKELRLTSEMTGLKPGNYKLKISKNGYMDSYMDVNITEGETSYHEVKLVPITTNLSITTMPSGANIFIDGNYAGTSPFYTEGVIIGTHKIKIAHNDYIVEERLIILEENKSGSLDIALKNHAIIKIESNPSGAEVMINGEHEGKSPLKLDVVTGETKINLRKEKYVPVEVVINIKSSGTYSYTLQKQKYQLKIRTSPSGAMVRIDGTEKGTSPQQFDLAFGSYRVAVEKDNYMGREKRINLKRDQIINLKLTKQFQGYFGMIYLPPPTRYSLYKIGFDFGWTYKKATRFLTGIGYNYGWTEDIETHVPADVMAVAADNYGDMDINSLKTDGFAEKKVNNFFVRFGCVVSRPHLVLSANMGLSVSTGYEVHVSDGHYTSTMDDDINAGDKFIDTGGIIDKQNFVYGFGALLPLGNFYLSGDYWVSNYFANHGPKYMFGLGYRF